MKHAVARFAAPWAAALALILAAAPRARAAEPEKPQLPPAATRPVDFARDIKPLFEARCLSCHAEKKPKSEFRLDVREEAMKGGLSGPSILPGKSAESLLIQNVARLDGATPMPPKGDPLTAEQVGLLRAWIDQGAVWPDDHAGQAGEKEVHWSFKAPVRPEPPAIQRADWPRNPIDNFILARLEKEGLEPSPQAGRVTLIRRLYLDLLGLPPSIADVDAFLADTDPKAYEKLVDRLLDNTHYGERWGRRWLDVARYADTNGYEKDRDRSIWPYRDWVVGALNRDLPFNEFAIEQLAGDMLPNATPEQIIATGFNRNTMINEEGGIDVEEFRYEAVVDRVLTTGQVFLGLTMNCAQCHNHKFDPISQKEYWQFYALLNNADEPQYDVPNPFIQWQREEIEAHAAAAERALDAEFPPYQEDTTWEPLDAANFAATSGATLARLDDGSLLVSGTPADKDQYLVTARAGAGEIAALRLEALPHDSFKNKGPGRSDNGNFVLSEIRVSASTAGGASAPAAFASASADFSQQGFPAANAIDGKGDTGWAVAGAAMGQLRTLTLELAKPLALAEGATLAIALDQSHGAAHTLGHFRLLAGRRVKSHHRPELPEAEQRRLHFSEKFEAWQKQTAQNLARWTPLDATSMGSKFHATLTKLDDKSILATGDKPNQDTTTIEFDAPAGRITALRLETLTDPSLPGNGPGRAELLAEGSLMVTEFAVESAPKTGGDFAKVELQNATADYAEGGNTADKAIDGNDDTGWTIGGALGKPHALVMELKQPLELAEGGRLRVTILQRYIHQFTLGRFRVSASGDARPVKASPVPDGIERILLTSDAARSPEMRESLKTYYLLSAPELAPQQKKLAALRRAAPRPATTMVMQERRTQPRETKIHHRGEFLSPRDSVEPGVPAVLPPLPGDAPADRLALARWIVSEKNPLTARVTMNRFWQAYFGRGLVHTTEDFGTRCEPPSHPELLDWLATEFIREGWSMKAMHRLIVTSATYRQSSRVAPELLERDPLNILLARGPRLRVEGEAIRDVALAASGLLNLKMGGPSVYPPQPPGVTELAYGSPKWTVSKGDDRYRRAIYTFWKRSAPYPGMTVFDAPTADKTCTRRERSNTPLQALTLLNDEVFVEASQAMARRIVAEAPAAAEDRARFAFRLCVARAPEPAELAKIVEFHEAQLGRFKSGDADAAKIASADPKALPAGADMNDLAAWTAVARALLNLDETITKE